MSDADLIYNALLRAERRVDKAVIPADATTTEALLTEALLALQRETIQVIREEVGNGLAERNPAP